MRHPWLVMWTPPLPPPFNKLKSCTTLQMIYISNTSFKLVNTQSIFQKFLKTNSDCDVKTHSRTRSCTALTVSQGVNAKGFYLVLYKTTHYNLFAFILNVYIFIVGSRINRHWCLYLNVISWIYYMYLQLEHHKDLHDTILYRPWYAHW